MIVNISYTNKGRNTEIIIDNPDDLYMDLADIIVPGLQCLRENRYGACSEFLIQTAFPSGTQLEFDFVDRDDEIQIAEERYREALDKMIWSFEQICSYEYHIQEPASGFATWEAYKDAVQDGLILFGKYFRLLWN